LGEIFDEETSEKWRQKKFAMPQVKVGSIIEYQYLLTTPFMYNLPNWKFQGIFAWFVWMFVHLFSLIGFRNKLVVFMNWVYNYIRFDRETRLIIRPFKKKNKYSFESDT